MAALALALLIASRAAAQFPPDPPDDPLYPDQGNLHPAICDVEGAWLTTIGDRSQIITILDSGADYSHEDVVFQYHLNMGEVAAETGAWDANGNGRLDRHDLALAGAGNGVDDDGNGYVDDFSGYDFDDDDNDEDDAIDFGHGAGRCGVIVAEADNGVGISGVCPGCSVVSVRIADTFVVSADDLAHGVVFATDTGASVVNMALGALGNSRSLRQAFEYGVANGVVFCASIGNQWSYHHHWPASYDDMIAMGALDPVTGSGPWAERANYSNFGAHLTLTSPSDTLTTYDGGGYGLTSGTSTASPHCSGMAALLRSRALELDTDGDPRNDVDGLTANEVKQLLSVTATDINRDTTDGAFAGWDQFTGYGRLHARRAVERVAAATIPPEADLDKPEWYTYLDPVETPLVNVRGMARARRVPHGTYTLEWGYGLEPVTFLEIASGTTPTIGFLGEWDLRDLVLDPGRPATHPQRFTVTLRLRVRDAAGNEGEDRRAVFVRYDPDLRDGFPIDLGSSIENSPILVDIDGNDGPAEIVFANSDGEVFVLDRDGNARAGWPAHTTAPQAYPDSAGYASGAVEQTWSSVVGAPAVGDIDGDCRLDIVVTTMQGTVEGFDRDGVSQFRALTDTREAFASAPALVDLDGDADLEIVAGSFDQRVYAFHHDGSEVAGWPVLARDVTMVKPDIAPIVSSPAVGDIDGDGVPEILIGTGEVYDGPDPTLGYGRAYAFHADGRAVAGWPVGGRSDFDLAILLKELDAILPVMGEGVVASPVLVDLDGDGAREVIIGTPTGQAYVFAGDGSLVQVMKPSGGGPNANSTLPVTLFGISTPAIADLDGDGSPDLLTQTITMDPVAVQAGGAFRKTVEFTAAAWSIATGDWLDGFPRVVEDWTVISSVSVADLDGDGSSEMIVPTAGYLLHAFDASGNEPVGWPKFTGGWIAPPVVGDLDGDGELDVVAATREGLLFAWRTTGTLPVAADGLEPWLRFHHDDLNTGDVHRDARPPSVPGGLAAARVGGDIRVTWTAPGDDGTSGRARSYALRWSQLPFGCDDWPTAAAVPGLPAPGPAGSPESFTFADPIGSGDLYVSVRAMDDSSNLSPFVFVQLGVSSGTPLLRKDWPVGTARTSVLPLDPTADLYDAAAASPFRVTGDVVAGGPGELFLYQVIGPPLLRAVASGTDVTLEF